MQYFFHFFDLRPLLSLGLSQCFHSTHSEKLCGRTLWASLRENMGTRTLWTQRLDSCTAQRSEVSLLCGAHTVWEQPLVSLGNLVMPSMQGSHRAKWAAWLDFRLDQASVLALSRARENVHSRAPLPLAMQQLQPRAGLFFSFLQAEGQQHHRVKSGSLEFPFNDLKISNLPPFPYPEESCIPEFGTFLWPSHLALHWLLNISSRLCYMFLSEWNTVSTLTEKEWVRESPLFLV